MRKDFHRGQKERGRLHRGKSAYLLAGKVFTSVAYWKSDTALSRVLQH